MVEQIYKQLFKDEEGRYLFATDEDTRYIIDQQSYLLIYILEVLLRSTEGEREIFFSNEKEKKE